METVILMLSFIYCLVKELRHHRQINELKAQADIMREQLVVLRHVLPTAQTDAV